MGEPIRIDELARLMIALSGHVAGGDVRIVYTGLRPGEKLAEELLTEEEEQTRAVRDRIRIATPPPPPVPGVIQYDDFAKVELKVAVVRAVEKVEKADKLLKLSVDAGEPEARTIVAGIAQAYPDPQALVGRRIVVVANLAPRALRGITSQGMLLAAGEGSALQLVTVAEESAPGTRVK